MEIKELGQKAVDQLKVDAKVMLKNQIEILFDEGMDLGVAELKAIIPGGIDDMIIDQMAPQLKAAAKAYVLALMDKM
jgi:hypothetical protein